MQNLLTSRSVIADKIYKKFSQSAYDIHKQKLKVIYTKEGILKDIQNQEISKSNLQRLTRNRKAYQSCHGKIDLRVKNQNKALFRNLQKIIMRRSHSEIGLSLQKNHFVENQKKQIKKENKILIEKIALTKLDIVDTKKNLLKQFRDYEDKKNMIRKVKDSPTHQQNSSIKRKSLSSRKLIKLDLKKQDSIIDVVQNKQEN